MQCQVSPPSEIEKSAAYQTLIPVNDFYTLVFTYRLDLFLMLALILDPLPRHLKHNSMLEGLVLQI